MLGVVAVGGSVMIRAGAGARAKDVDVALAGWLMGEDVRPHAICLRQFFLLVTVDLGECDLVRTRELAGQRVVDRGDGFAWSAPVGVD